METPFVGSSFGGRAIAGLRTVGTSVGAGFAARALFDGCVSVALWPRRFVEGLLPRELRLEDAPVLVAPGGDEFPVLIACGRQRETAWTWGGVVTPIGPDYDELAFLVPFVRHCETRESVSFVIGMASSDVPVTWIGNRIFGLRKELLRARRDGCFSVWTDEAGALAFHAIFEECAGAIEEGVVSESIATLLGIASRPVLGRRDDGRWIRCGFDWDFAHARTRAIRAAMSIDRPLRSGVPAISFHGEPGATIWVDGMVWRLSWPVRCPF